MDTGGRFPSFVRAGTAGQELDGVGGDLERAGRVARSVGVGAQWLYSPDNQQRLALGDVLGGQFRQLAPAGDAQPERRFLLAGAFVDGDTCRRAHDCGLEVTAALAANDSYKFFAPLGDLFQPGPTGTNVMDIKIVLTPAF